MLRFFKIWQTEHNALVLHVGTEPGGEGPKKFYIVVGLDGEAMPILGSVEKPPHIKPQGGAAALIRKHLGQISSLDIFKDADNSLWVVFGKTGAFAFRVFNKKPWQIEFLSRGVSYLRFGAAGSFGIKKTWDGPWLENLSPFSVVHGLKPKEDGDEALTLQNEVSSFQRETAKRMARRLKALRQSYSKILMQRLSPDELKALELRAKMLQAYAYLIKPQQFSLALEPELTNGLEALVIELDPEKTPGANVEEAFIRLKKAKRGQGILEAQTKSLEDNICSLDSHLTELRAGPVDDEKLHNMLERHKLPIHKQAPPKKQQDSNPFWIFRGQHAPRLLVGKSSKDNDALVKISKSNDHWFHVVQGSGSHVLIPARDLGQTPLNEKMKNEAAILAVHYSKLRQDQKGEVYVTTRGHLKKKKGMPDGLWLVEKSQVMFVTYTQDELKQVLDGLFDPTR